MTEFTMSKLVSDLGIMVGGVIDWSGDILAFVTGNPLLLAFAGISLFSLSVITVKSFTK